MSSSRRRRRRRRLGAWLVAVAAALSIPGSAVAPGGAATAAGRRQAAADEPSQLWFEPPVDAAISDGWRPPATPYGPGNRGWEYDTAPGDVVRVAGDGTVRFAGPVGGAFAVTVAHVGGLETTYSTLDAVDVTEGRRVRRGDEVGTAGETFHFGVRLDGAYVDPAVLFRAGALRLGARLLGRRAGRPRPAERPPESATLTHRSVDGRPLRRVTSTRLDPTHHPAPGPPTVATRAGPGTSEPMGRRRPWPLSA